MYAVKVLKPNKAGKLKCVKRISAKKASEIHWNNFRDDPNRTGTPFNKNTSVKYHRIEVILKKCAEDDCNVTVSDPRRKTCSKTCHDKRTIRQRVSSRVNENVTVICKYCKKTFIAARKDRLYCNKVCRINFHK